MERDDGVLQELCSQFPRAGGVQCIFGYGSGVFKQVGYDAKEQPMLDFVVVVDDASEWHAKTLLERPTDYALLPRRLGAAWVSAFQRWKGGKAWFNTDVDFTVGKKTFKVKYGVIETRDLVQDLDNWETLYFAGRLHKPVRFLAPVHNAAVATALDNNLVHALHTALFLLPECFSEEELYRTIASLSYQGDVRMRLAENPRKVDNIVSGSFEHFQRLYRPLLETPRGSLFRNSSQQLCASLHLASNLVSQDLAARPNLFQAIPVSSQTALSRYADQKMFVERELARRVSASSRVQSLKGLVTAGFTKSLVYGLRKVGKRFS